MAPGGLARRVREHLEDVRLLGGGRIGRVRGHEGTGLVPDLLPLALDCVRVVYVHRFPGLETEKPLVREAVRKLRGGPPRSLPRLQKELVHLPLSLAARPRCCQRRRRAHRAAYARGCARLVLAGDRGGTRERWLVGAPRVQERRCASRNPPPTPMRPSLPPNPFHGCDETAPRSCLPFHRQNRRVLELYPDTAWIDGDSLVLGELGARELLAAHGSPLVVYDEATLRASARAYRAAAPDAFVSYGTKAFPNVALLRLLAGEGIGADVSTLGELRFAQAAGIAGDRIVVHGNNKSDDELSAAAEAGALVVLDSLEEIERARAAGVTRTLIRVTPGIEADTHEHIRTGHHGSKFGLPPDDALEAIRRAPEAEGIHAHVGSQLLDTGAALMAVDWLASFAARARAETGWQLRTIDLGGGLGVATSSDDPQLGIEPFVRALVAELQRACDLHGLGRPQVMLEPGRSLVGRAGVTLYTVGSVKRA